MEQKTIGRYQVIEELGRGGMATVFRAYDPRFEREVALKVLPRALLHDPTFRERFDQEAKTIAQLDHRAIVPVYDFGEHEDQPYIVMRLMRGGTLTSRLADGPLPLPEISAILTRVCAALDKAHRNQVIHRDLKPGNILFDEEGAAYLGDFGIATLAESTQTITFIGTPKYMAPEQITTGQIDAQTDVYQLGVVLFEMLTGQVPFEADTPPASFYKHVHSPIPPLHPLNTHLTLAHEEIVQRAMAKEKAARFASAGALAAAFENITADTETAATPPPQEHKPSSAETVTRPTPSAASPIPNEDPARPSGNRRLYYGVLLSGVVMLGVMAGMWGLNWGFFGASTPSPEPTENVTPPVVIAVNETVAPAQVTAAPTVHEVSITQTPSPIPPTPTTMPSPAIKQFSTCVNVCNGGNQTTQFPEGTTSIYVQWEYENIPKGAEYVRTWSTNGQTWVRYECNWPGPTSGWHRPPPLTEPGGFRSGLWEVEILVNGEVILHEELFVQGNLTYFSPVVGTLNDCFDS